MNAYGDRTGVFEPDSKPYGETYAQWSANWCIWLLSIPKENSPLFDYTGEKSAQWQMGPVWFLTGTTGGQAHRKCIIPADKGILFPVVMKECSFAENVDLSTEDELGERAKEDMDNVIFLEVEIDGLKMEDLIEYRVHSKLFDFVFPRSNIYDVKPGRTRGVCNGYWILLKPMSQCRHIIHFGAHVYVQEGTVLAEQSKLYNRMDGNVFKTDVTYEITVRP